MKAAINQWAFPADMPAVKAISMAKEIGFEAFEPCVGIRGPIPLAATKADIEAIRKHAADAGMELTSIGCGLGWDLPMTSPDPSVRQRGKEALSKTLQIAQWMGVDSVLTVPGLVTPEVSYDVAMENALASIQDLVPTAEKLKVTIAVENVWNKFLLSPIETRDFIDQFDSEYVGAYMDVGNIILYGYPEQWIRILGKRIRMAHAKDFRASTGNMDGFVMLLEGSVDWPRVMAAFREVGYDRALVAEFGPYTYSLEALLKHVLVGLKTILSL